jgi:hypothetical protein
MRAARITVGADVLFLRYKETNIIVFEIRGLREQSIWVVPQADSCPNKYIYIYLLGQESFFEKCDMLRTSALACSMKMLTYYKYAPLFTLCLP